MTTAGPRPSFLKLQPGKPYIVLAKAARYEDRVITDPVSKQQKTLSVLVLDLVEVDGVDQETQLSFTSFKAQQALDPLLKAGQLLMRPLQVTWSPKGFATDYEFRIL